VPTPVLSRLAILALISVVTSVASAHAAGTARPPTQRKAQAEINVLRAVVQLSKSRRMPELVDPRTHLLVNNTQALCRGRGKRYLGPRYTRFDCVVRPLRHRPRQGLYVGYRVRPNGRFAIHYLAYKR
jgi:hypothetical protein